MKAKKGDFVEVVYTGRLDDGHIFDLNDREVAEKENLDQKALAPKTIACLGEKDLVPGLDNFLIDKEIGEKLKVDLKAEEAFGKKEADLIQMVPVSKFKEQKINPVPGLRLNIDNMVGIIKIVSGGRVMVDFNHALAGKNVHYEVLMKREVTDIKEKVESFLKLSLNLKELDVKENEGNVSVKLALPDQLHGAVEEQVKKRVKEVKSVKFEK
ncbi:peptidylprolyl isomerase [archaeon]|jgi:FKBP-type peptidyl-prolyl cis-trans isomerase 2|nr:peptidylprolyl isomerase [archaeon]MBT3730769.1 peptidylprolyl isomerase [archaeon]MBT4669671.1 peptidylprolyl isomerase [archaeon]MBT5030428.1 peptidylprolyl isomerase [archaeon]MBT5288279.1 peptidylprolyl isomerase [archaeon]